MLIAPDALLRSLRQQRCLQTQRPLSRDETLLSQSKFPSLYARTFSEPENRYIQHIFRTLRTVLESDVPIDLRDEIARFMALVIHNGAMSYEAYVHLYLFHFWNECWLNPAEGMSFSEKYFEGEPGGAARTAFSERLLPRLRGENAYPDIVGLGGPGGYDLNIVEIKLEELDDRAVGQVLRYYSIARDACDRTWHGCDVRRVRPLLVVATIRLAFWLALPVYFREFLQIATFRVDPGTRRLLLTDARRALDTQVRESLSRR